eukprot:373424-Amphidinium_carterae.1
MKKGKSASSTDQFQGEEEPPVKKAKSASSTDQLEAQLVPDQLEAQLVPQVVPVDHSSYSAVVLLPDGSLPNLELTAGPVFNAIF